MEEQKKRNKKTEYKNRYQAENYDQVRLVVPKGEKERIKAAADAERISINAYIVQAIKEKMER